jgi:hypothetical protein
MQARQPSDALVVAQIVRDAPCGSRCLSVRAPVSRLNLSGPLPASAKSSSSAPPPPELLAIHDSQWNTALGTARD